MNEHMRAILESKRRERSRLASLSFSRKIPLLEKLRDRSISIERSPLYLARGFRSAKVVAVREPGVTSQSK